MAKIPLRTYNNEIETIIEQQQTEEAIAHCRHILKIYPKHIDTYRLLGKAYLESGRLGNAADIFERVLSAIPYDFVSHVGLSITSEDIGDLDKAIWHMERAFEGQPYNAAIQGELRRLYGKRDGMEPPKIHLTRAALARMYAKGNLFQQAIAELRAEISEDPNRFDLRIFLAKMYIQIGETTKAIDSCGTILKKLPYCFDANQLLVQLLIESGRADESEVYRKRLQELDPYQAHINPNAPDKDHIQDQAVLVEQLIWDGGTAVVTTDQPDWATSVGVTIEDSEADKDDFQDWLENSSEANDFFSNDAEEVLDDQEDDLIPEFMKDAGWEPSTGSIDQSKTITDFDRDENEIIDEAVEGELPDWLQKLAPTDENIINGDDLMDVIEADDSIELFGVDESDQEEKIFSDEQIPQQIPDWLSELDSETDSKSESDSLPDWLVEKEDNLPIASEDTDENKIPDWLIPTTLGTVGVVGAVSTFDNKEIEEKKLEADEKMTQDSVTEASKDEIDSRSTPIIAEVTEQDFASSAGDADSPDIPEWLNEPDIDNDTAQMDDSQLPDWLLDIEDNSDSLISDDEELPEQIPEWLVDVIDDESQVEEVEEVMAEEESQPEWSQDTLEKQEEPTLATIDGDLSDGVEPMIEEELASSEPGTEISSKSEIVKDSEDEFPDKTSEIIIDQDSPSDVQSIFSEDIGVAIGEELDEKGFDQVDEEAIATEETNIPGWIQEVVETEEDIQEVIEQAPQLDPEEELTQSDEFDDQDSALVWLETIALAQEELDKPDDTSLDDIKDVLDDSIPEDDLVFQSSTLDDVTEIPDVTDTIDLMTESDLDKEDIPIEDSEKDQLFTVEEINDTALLLDNEQILETGEQAESMEESADVYTVEGVDDKKYQIQIEDDADETFAETDSLIESTSIEVEDTDISFTWLDEIEPQQEISDEEIQLSSEVESDKSLSEIQAEDMGLPELSVDLISVSELDDSDERLASQEVRDEPDFDDVDAALAWLEGLAAKQGISEDELLTSPDDRSETPPEWVHESTQTDMQVESDLDASFEILGEETPDLETESFQKSDTDHSPQNVSSSEIDPTIESGEKLEDVDAAMAWLESLAAKQGVSEDELLTTPSERSDTPPEWVLKSKDIETESITIDDQEILTESAISQDDEIPYAPPAWVTDGQVPEDDELSWLPTEESEDEKQLLDLNQASLIQLERLPGIGFRKAQSITAYRDEHGEFRSLDSLMNVPGMDHETLELLKARVTILTDDIKLQDDASQQEELYIHFHAEPDDENHEKQLSAQAKLNSGSIEEAMDDYQKLIQNGKRQEAVIDDLIIAAEKYPNDVSIWQTLGDAYMNSNRLQDAIEAYTKAQNLLD
jgi:competence ComEA-like helix-hairpin-helix protein